MQLKDVQTKGGVRNCAVEEVPQITHVANVPVANVLVKRLRPLKHGYQSCNAANIPR